MSAGHFVDEGWEVLIPVNEEVKKFIETSYDRRHGKSGA
jgi:hypothetical protein